MLYLSIAYLCWTNFYGIGCWILCLTSSLSLFFFLSFFLSLSFHSFFPFIIFPKSLLKTGLVVMGGESCSEGRGFESQCRILDGHFPLWFVVKNCIICLKKSCFSFNLFFTSFFLSFSTSPIPNVQLKNKFGSKNI